jgi:hypothetical protein
VAVVDARVEELFDVYESHGDSFPAAKQIEQPNGFTRQYLRGP